jgi:IS4 transposase
VPSRPSEHLVTPAGPLAGPRDPSPAGVAAAATPVAKAAVEVVGAEYVQLLQHHLATLHAARAHPNRTLHYDTVLVALLLGFYSGVRSLRGIEDLSEQPKFHDDDAEDDDGQIPVDRVCRSTLSDALRAFDPAPLQRIVTDLLRRLPQLRRHDDDLHALMKNIIALDGSIFTVPAEVAWAIALHRRNGDVGRQLRLNVHLDVLHFVPTHLQVCGDDQSSESASFIASLVADQIYVADRNFVDFTFMHAVLDVGSDLVVRLKSDTTFAPLTEQPLDDADRAANVTSDRIGHVPGSRGSPGFGTQHLREVIVIDPRTNKPVRLLTSLLDCPARIIGLLYRYRWMIELFFRWLKCVAKFEHLFSLDRNGVTTQFYVAVIALLLTYLRTGNRPGVYEFNCLSWIASGIGTVASMQRVLARRNRERAQARARYAAKQQQQQHASKKSI